MADLDTVKAAIVEREDELRKKFQQESIVPRDVSAMLSQDVALVITGVRRCGKSILAYMLARGKKSAYVNFEDERLNIDASHLNIIMEAISSLKGDVDTIVFDEIQNIKGWQRFVARLLPTKKIIITGSNAHLLSRELSTLLTGRHIDVVLFPFSFHEFCAWKGFEFSHRTPAIAQVKAYMQEYIQKGGFPLAYTLGNIFLVEVYKDILERDIVQRFGIRRVQEFKDISKYLLSHFGRELSFNQLRNVFGLKSVHTIKKYVSYLQSSYLILILERFSYKLKEQALAPKKAYCIDTGMILAGGFQVSENEGLLIENVVAIELWRRRHDIYYWKNHQQQEVDFVVKKDKKVTELIQVCIDISHIGTKDRELRSLLTASKDLRCTNLLIITKDVESEEKYDGKKVRIVPLWKWLLKLD